jgi:hygromycin-B 4-O-kinase
VELGKYAAAINRIWTHDFGHIFDWSPNALSRNKTWPEYLVKELAVEERVEILRRSRLMQPKKVKGLERELQKIRRWKGRPSLAHGDIRLKNVVLDKTEKITAILDWENCISSMAPYWELSIALHDLTMDEKETFLEGYGLGLDEYLEIAPSIKALNLLNYAPYLQRALKRKDKARLQELRARLNGAFDLYSL